MDGDPLPECVRGHRDRDAGLDAQVAEIPYTAFTSRPKAQQVPGRLIVRLVKRLGAQAADGRDELFTTWRHHAVFVTSRVCDPAGRGPTPRPRQHRQAIADGADGAAGALAHLPSGSFSANAARAVLWAIAHNLTRAAGALASKVHARATTATIRAHLINVRARLGRGARRLTLHLPEGWPWQAALAGLHATVHRPAAATARTKGPNAQRLEKRPDRRMPHALTSQRQKTQDHSPRDRTTKMRSVDPG